MIVHGVLVITGYMFYTSFFLLNKVFNHVVVEMKTKAKSLRVFDADIKL